MTRSEAIRAAMVVSGAAAATAARADGAGVGISSAGWFSMLGVVGIAGVLYWVFKKVG